MTSIILILYDNQCLSPLTLWVKILFRRVLLNTALRDKVCQWRSAGRWFSLGIPVSSTNKTDRHNITEILLKVALNTITLTLIRYTPPSSFEGNLTHQEQSIFPGTCNNFSLYFEWVTPKINWTKNFRDCILWLIRKGSSKDIE